MAPTVNSVSIDAVPVGEAIAQARQAHGMSLEELSARTRLRLGILTAIEGGDMSAFGGDAYARAHLRGIAGILGLDPDAIIGLYEAAL